MEDCNIFGRADSRAGVLIVGGTAVQSRLWYRRGLHDFSHDGGCRWSEYSVEKLQPGQEDEERELKGAHTDMERCDVRWQQSRQEL